MKSNLRTMRPEMVFHLKPFAQLYKTEEKKSRLINMTNTNKQCIFVKSLLMWSCCSMLNYQINGMGRIKKYFTIHSLPVFCCHFTMWDWSAGWGIGLSSFSSSTCAAPDHSEVGGDLESFSGSFLTVSDASNLWGIQKRRDKIHLVSRVTTGLWMIYDFKDKGVKNWLFSSSLSWDLHVWIKHTSDGI